MDNIITIQDKIDIINQHLEAIEIHISWLNNNIGIIEEIPYEGKPTMQEQLINFLNKKNALISMLSELELMI